MPHDKRAPKAHPPGPTNRLAREKSPYLLQHAHNPVDWYPWGEEAFAKARAENKPVFLSIGYSTCHWCHVMERESFEDPDVARLLNSHFVNIKVDREERPDIDHVYMTVCQLMTGSGGWPLTIVMTPDKEPFFAGTYFPKQSRFGRMGLVELVPRISEIWRDEPDKALDAAQRVSEHLRSMERGEAGEAGEAGELDEAILHAAFGQLDQHFDGTWGGFGSAPKFPTPHNLLFLLRYAKRTSNPRALEMVEITLRAMRAGGIYDHLGYGFHRYSTDTRWLLPHFEKMLYDQAMLMMAYAEAHRLGGDPRHAETVQEVAEYVCRDLRHEDGGFLSAEDADSEGVEGKFYVWTAAEIDKVLGPGSEAAELVRTAYGVSPEGNFLEEATRERTGANILHLAQPLPVLANQLGMAEDKLVTALAQARRTLFEVREERIRPHLDDKVLTDWNGLMIAALAVASKCLDDPQLAAPAAAAADFVLGNMQDENGRLLHRWRDGEAAVVATLNDYAYFIWGLVELYEATLAPCHLEHALRLAGIMNEFFWDQDGGGFYFTAADAEQLLVRQKEVFDGALPSGNAVAMLALAKLGRMTGTTDFSEQAARIAGAFAAQAAQAPVAFTMLLCGLDFALGPGLDVTLMGQPGRADLDALHRAALAGYQPGRTVVLRDVDQERTQDGLAAATVCRDFACSKPVSDPAELAELVRGS